MKKTLLLFLLLTGPILFAQVNLQNLTAGLEENKDFNRLDSIARVLNYKGGDLVSVFAQFTVNEEGEITDVVAKGPHPLFEAEAVKLLKELPKMEPAIVDGEAVSQRFSLPLKFRIETEREKKKRLKKERNSL